MTVSVKFLSLYLLHPPFKQQTSVFVEFSVESIRQVDTSSISVRKSSRFRLAVSGRQLTQLCVETDPETALEEPGAVGQPLGQPEERHSTEVGGGALEQQPTANG